MNNAKPDYRLHKTISSPLLCGYTKGFITQTVLLYLNEKWNFMLGKKIIRRCYPDGSF